MKSDEGKRRKRETEGEMKEDRRRKTKTKEEEDDAKTKTKQRRRSKDEGRRTEKQKREEEQAVQEYKQQRLASTTHSPSRDAVLITEADLEGYHSSCDDDGNKELKIVPIAARARPVIERLSCLFAYLKVSGGCGPVLRQLTAARAC